MDNDELNHEAGEVPPLPGLAPLVEQAIQQALKDQAAGAAAAVVADRLAEQDLDELAHRALERELLDLAEPAGPYFATLPEWIEQWLLPVYRRSVRGHERVWCPEWWRHPEAVARLDALWRAWEHLRLDAATGLSVWFRDHADHHMTVLMAADGPFKGCDGTHSERPVEPLPSTPPPRGHVRARRRPHTHDARRHPSCLPRRLYRRCRTQLDDPASSMNHPLPHGLGTRLRPTRSRSGRSNRRWPCTSISPPRGLSEAFCLVLIVR